MQSWVYEVVETRHVHPTYLEPVLNERGAEGWELVNVHFQANLTTFIFKRPSGEVASSSAEAVA